MEEKKAIDEKSFQISWPLLALLRFILAAIVMVDHLPWRGYGFLSNIAAGDGLVSVIGFLMISGYSIAASIDRQSKGFYERRFLRIYPLFFGAVIFSQILSSFSTHIIVPTNWKTAICNLLIPNCIICIPPAFNPPLWSLGVEITYYILAPILYRLRTSRIYLILVISIIADIVIPFSMLLWGMRAISYLWAWLLGFQLYRNRSSSIIWLIALCSIVPYLDDTHPDKYAWITYAVTSISLIGAIYARLPRKLGAICDYLGEISYPLYLFHNPIQKYMFYVLELKNPFLSILVCIIFSVLAHHVIELPFKKFWWKHLHPNSKVSVR